MTASPDFPTALGLAEARARIVAACAARRLGSEDIDVCAALGRVAAVDVHAPFDVPGFANSAMDGFAVRAADLPQSGQRSLRLVDEAFAGGHAPRAVASGECVRIMTGAPLPPGADTVVMKEDTHDDGAAIRFACGTAPGANVRPAGEDYRRGDAALACGTALGPAHLGVLASFGMTRIAVRRRVRAVLLTTGDELVAPGTPLAFGQIHDSNRYSLGGLLEQHGVELLRHERLGDDPGILRDALVRAGADADIIVSSGGVSAGDADYMPRLIGEVGRVDFWKVRFKPGMPFLFGEVRRALMFALPGNPVSGIAIFLALLAPGLDALTGATAQQAPLRARLAEPISKRHARAEFQRARLRCDAQGTLQAPAQARQGSGMLRGVAEADALLMLPEGAHEFAAGDVVDVLPLPGWPRV
jgi:molybdopterin molybdotransferase